MRIKYNKKEDEWLKQHYSKYGPSWCSKYYPRTFPRRNRKSIKQRARKIKLIYSIKNSNKGIKWTQEEIEKLRKVGPYYLAKELVAFFPNRTWQAIKTFKQKLGIEITKDTRKRMANNPKRFVKPKYNFNQFNNILQEKNIPIKCINPGKTAYRHHSKFECKKCRYIWSTYFYYIAGLSTNKSGCPKCNRGISRGNRKIIEILTKYNINFNAEYRFKNCRSSKNIPLPFDFYINQNNSQYAIEYQGKQHYIQLNDFFGKNCFERLQQNDKVKREYCYVNDITFIEIPYWKYKNIENILLSHLEHLIDWGNTKENA